MDVAIHLGYDWYYHHCLLVLLIMKSTIVFRALARQPEDRMVAVVIVEAQHYLKRQYRHVLLLGHLVLVKEMEMVVVLVKGKLAILFEMKQYLLFAVLLLWLVVAEALIILYRMADGLDYVQYWHMRELLLVRLVMDSDLVL
jgi:hypothetical protein